MQHTFILVDAKYGIHTEVEKALERTKFAVDVLVGLSRVSIKQCPDREVGLDLQITLISSDGVIVSQTITRI